MRARTYISALCLILCLPSVHAQEKGPGAESASPASNDNGDSQSKNIAPIDCLEAVSPLVAEHKYLTVMKTDRSTVKGRLMRLDLETNSLTLVLRQETSLKEVVLSRPEMLSISYRKSGKIQPVFALLGTGIGLLVGHLAETQIFDRGGNAKIFKDAGNSGWFYGAIGGVVTGSAVSLLVRYTKTIQCERE